MYFIEKSIDYQKLNDQTACFLTKKTNVKYIDHKQYLTIKKHKRK